MAVENIFISLSIFAARAGGLDLAQPGLRHLVPGDAAAAQAEHAGGDHGRVEAQQCRPRRQPRPGLRGHHHGHQRGAGVWSQPCQHTGQRQQGKVVSGQLFTVQYKQNCVVVNVIICPGTVTMPPCLEWTSPERSWTAGPWDSSPAAGLLTLPSTGHQSRAAPL